MQMAVPLPSDRKISAAFSLASIPAARKGKLKNDKKVDSRI